MESFLKLLKSLLDRRQGKTKFEGNCTFCNSENLFPLLSPGLLIFDLDG